MSPQNMPLWRKDYFELKVLEKQIQEKLPALFLSSWKQDIHEQGGLSSPLSQER